MAELQGDLSLETRDAEREIERLGPVFDRVVDRFSVELAKALDQLTSLPAPDIDLRNVESAVEDVADSAGDQLALALEGGAESAAGPIADAVSGGVGDVGDQLTLALEGGAEESAAGISDAISEAVSAADTTVEIDADTSAAEGQLDDLASKAEDAGGALGDLGGAAKGAGALGSVATGSFAGLGSALGDLPGRTAGAVGAIVGVGGAVAGFFNEAVEARGATQRFNSVLGDMADEVENLRSIDGLNTNLGDLALQLGSDDDRIRSVAARLFELADASGKTSDEASQFTQRMVALGARAVALNPQLGDVGDVTDALSTALVRGGRFAAKFGLDLNQADINARALKDTNKDNAEELTFVEKAMAGAALATEKYGDNLDRVINRGSQNAITRLRSLRQTVVENIEALGTPLIAPVFELLEEAVPVAQEAGRVLTALAQATLPTFIATLRAVNPLLTILADVLERIPAPVLTAALAFAAFRGPVKKASDILTIFGNQSLTTGDKVGRIGVGLGLAITSFDQIGESATQSAVGIAGMAASGALIGSAFGQPALGAAVGTVVGLGKALFGGGESAEEMRKRVNGLAREIESLGEKRAATRFLDQIKIGFDDISKRGNGTVTVFRGVRRELEELGRSSPAAAQRVVDGLRQMGSQSGLTVTEIDKLQASVDRSAEALARKSARVQEAQQINQGFIQSEAAAAEAAKLAAEEAQEAWDNYVSSLQENQPTITSLFDTAIKVAQDFAAENKVALDPNVIVEQLAKQTQGVKDFSENVNFILNEGLDDLAALVLQKGPEAGGAVAQAFADATPETRRRAEEQLEAASGVINALAEQIAGPLAERLESSAFAAGTGLTSGLVEGLRRSRPQAVREAEATANAVEQALLAELGISSPSKVAIAIGEEIGRGLGIGMDQSVERFVSPSGQRLAMRAVAPVAGAAGGSSTTSIDRSFHAFEGATIVGRDAAQASDTSMRRLRAASFFGGR